MAKPLDPSDLHAVTEALLDATCLAFGRRLLRYHREARASAVPPHVLLEHNRTRASVAVAELLLDELEAKGFVVARAPTYDTSRNE